MRGRILSLVALFLSAAALPVRAGGTRSATDILADHGQALGTAKNIATLQAQATLRTRDGRQVKGVVVTWKLPGEMRRDFLAKGAPYRSDYFSGKGAFVLTSFLERYVPAMKPRRGAYYALKALATPFPLLPYVADDAAAKRLSVGEAKGYEVLATGYDEYGVREVFLLDEKTHMLMDRRFVTSDGTKLAEVFYNQYESACGTMLPRFVETVFSLAQEDSSIPGFRKFEYAQTMEFTRWTRGVKKAGFFVPGGGGGGAGPGYVRKAYPTGPDPYEVAAGDLDGDGKVDLAAACFGGVYVNFGGDREAPVKVPLGAGHERGLSIVDLDRDGHPEIVTTSNVDPAQMFFVIRFDRARKATVRKIYGAPLFCSGLLTPDLDLDGIPDIVSIGGSAKRQTVKIDFGNGTGGLRNPSTFWPLDPKDEGRTGWGVAVGDADGVPPDDIAVADGKRVVLFQGSPNLSFQPKAELVTGAARGVQFADLNGDGRDDLLVVNAQPPHDIPHDLGVFLNTGSGFKLNKLYNAGAWVQDVKTGDLDGDGHLDAVTASFLSGEVWELRGDGKGGFRPPVRHGVGHGASRLCLADVDGDGRLDIVASARLDEKVVVLYNRLPGPAHPVPPPPGATVCAGPVKADFTMKGLSHRYAFAGEYRLPAGITDASGLAFFSGDALHTSLVLVSDKRSALFRLTLDRKGERLLVSPPIPLRGKGAEKERLDLEAVDFDRASGTLFLGCESDSSILRCTAFGTVLSRVASEVPVKDNDGIEGLAVRRLKDGTPLLYVFKERMGLTLKQPPVFVEKVEQTPKGLALTPRLKTELPIPVVDQTAAHCTGDTMYVVSRLAREIYELHLDGDGFAKKVKRASFKELTDDDLGLVDARWPMFGTVEGLAIDDQVTGDLFLCIDNNRGMVGRKEKGNRGTEARVLWFRDLDGPVRHPSASMRVVARRILFPDPGAKGDRKAVEARARACLKKAEAGADFDALEKEYGSGGGGLPDPIRAVSPPFPPATGEVPRANLPPALAQTLFALRVGEAALVEYDPQVSPAGWYVVRRIR